MMTLPTLDGGLDGSLRIDISELAADAPLEGSVIAEAGRSALGEHPVWDEFDRQLLWVDILGDRVHGWSPTTAEVWSVQAQSPSLVWPCLSGRILLATASGIILHERGRTGSLDLDRSPAAAGRPSDMPAISRFNDGACAPDGSLWISSMDSGGEANGILYRVSVSAKGELVFQPMIGGLACGNGIGWSLDGTVCYFIESVSRAIYRFDFVNGRLLGGEPFIAFSDQGPLPDGLTIDQAGNIWVAFWDGSCIARISPDAQIVEARRLPTSRPTCPGFGQPGDRKLLVTSAIVDDQNSVPKGTSVGTEAGMIYGLDVEIEGLPTTLFNDGGLK